MAEHHSLLDLHHEVIRPPDISHLAPYRAKTKVTTWLPADVGKQSAHSVSDHLPGRSPYPEPAPYDYLEPTISHGRMGVSKTVDVLKQLVEMEIVEDDDDSKDRVLRLKRSNVNKLLEAIYDHAVIGEAVANTSSKIDNVVLIKALLSNPDPQVHVILVESLIVSQYCHSFSVPFAVTA